MTIFPVYHDSLTHDLLGKSQLPFFVTLTTLHKNFPMHHHNFAELSVVIRGSGTEILNGSPHSFQRGTVSLLLPHHIHEIHTTETPVLKYTCMFDLNILFLSTSDHILGKTILKTGSELPSHYDLNEEQTVYMVQIMEQLLHEYNTTQFAKETVIRSKLMDALVFLLRTHQNFEESKAAPHEVKNNILEILQYMHLHYQEEMALSGLAKLFNWNASYMSRIFKQHVGHTFTEYLHLLRIGRAVSLLASTTMSISDISVEVGFDHTRTFTRVFKELKGTSPSQFRILCGTSQAGEREIPDTLKRSVNTPPSST